MDILLWANGPLEDGAVGDVAWFHSHPFNVGQHVAHNAMLDECVRRGANWHIRIDDDCWLSGRNWLKRLLAFQEAQAKDGKGYVVVSPLILGLDAPPPAVALMQSSLPPATSYRSRLNCETIERVEILGGIFRMAPMSIMRYFRWDERQPMGFGDATQFSAYCSGIKMPMARIVSIKVTHGDSTARQRVRDRNWDYEHDMLQMTPVGL